MIIKIIFYSFLIFVYHLLLLVLPLNFFLIGLKIPFIIKFFPWLFYPFLLFSPILTVLLAIRSTPTGIKRFDWIYPIAVSVFGYSPIVGSYFLISSLNNSRDYWLVALFPILIGLIAFWGSRFLTSSKCTDVSR